MISHSTKIRIRYSETDQMGFVYHGNYAQFYEIGRVELLRKLGINYKKLEQDGTMLPVLEINSKFLRPITYDEVITITATLTAPPSVKMIFNVKLHNEAGVLCHEATTTLVCVDPQTMKPKRCPQKLIELFQEKIQD